LYSAPSARSPAGAPAAAQVPTAAEAAMEGFRARFDRLSRADAGQRGFFLDVLL
jgi:hypothetical protein